MMNGSRFSGFLAALFALFAGSCLRAESAAPAQTPIALEITSVDVSGRPVRFRKNGEASLGPYPGEVVFHFECNTNAGRLPIRLRYKLEGYENIWHEGDGEVYLGVRYYNDAGDQVSQEVFNMRGESAGWRHSIEASSLTRRRETVTVPPHASRLMLVISSAGPPATEGIYVMANLLVTKSSGRDAPVVLMRSPFDKADELDAENPAPPDWMRDGNHASMAKIVNVGKGSTTNALAIFDNDPFSHAEWHSTLVTAPSVKPGDELAVEWDEMYSVGLGNFAKATYNNLPVGNFTFRVEETDMFGVPTGAMSSLSLVVPPPFWRSSWFWGAVLIIVSAASFTGWRYLAWHQLRMEMQHLKSQQALERERLRIAHDIHDDLGARVTQISLLSAVSLQNAAFPEKARADFDRISRMSRELVFALYETVWAVNPENDNLDALGNYLCQMVNQLCECSQFRCRFHMSDLPQEIQVSSQTRHNVSMAVKEAVHNVIKHAGASEVVISVKFSGQILSISVQDDGKGFEPGGNFPGSGLHNMKRRLQDVGGTCSIESKPGKGSTVHFELGIKPQKKTGSRNSGKLDMILI